MSVELESQIDSLRRRLNITTTVAGVGILLAFTLGAVAILKPAPAMPKAFDPEHAGNIGADAIVARGIGITGSDGVLRMMLHADEGQPVINLKGKHDGSIRIGFNTYQPKDKEADEAYVTLGSKLYSEELSLSSGVGGTSIATHAEGANSPLWISSDSDGHSFISLTPNSPLKGYNQFSMSTDGKPGIRMVDGLGKVVFDTDETSP